MRIIDLRDGVLRIAAANSEKVKTVIISAGTWGKHADLEDNLYLCDPDKNVRCRKTGCYIKGGECSLTKNPRYRRELP